MAVINVLDKHTAELIAAGEVVERPASVVKELVENSIDAGATKVLVDIEQGGVKKILVQDNGSGIDSEYVKTAFIRHATSKISSKEDLDQISSLGFRGEALASIASVSNLTLITKTEIQDFAVEIKLSGGQETSFEIKPFVTGSQFIVRDLFYNTPARMKFLKKDATEAGYVQDILTNLALSKPDIAFTFVRDGKEIFSTIGDGNLLNTIASLFSTDFAQSLTQVDYEDAKYRITGYVTLPHSSRQSRNMQFSFINGRFVKNKTVIAATENAYKGTVMVGKFPGYILNIQMPYDAVDVNVHPAKTEVRFSNDSEMFSTVYRAVKSAVTGDTQLKKFDFQVVNTSLTEKNTVKQQSFTDVNSETKTDFSAKEVQNRDQNNGYGTLQIDIKPSFDKNRDDNVSSFADKYITSQFEADSGLSLASESPVEYKRDNFTAPQDRTSLPYNSKISISPRDDDYSDTPVQNDNFTDNQQEISAENQNSFLDSDWENIKVIGEIFSTYILCQINDELIVIDKHAAHERILYERLKKNMKAEKQILLVPAPVKLSAEEKNAVMENIDLLDEQGFEIEDLGSGGVIVRAIPMYITSEDPRSLVGEIAYNLSMGNKAQISEKLDWIFHSVACRSAIKAGDKAEITQLTELVRDIRNEKIPLYCPHGRPVMISISKKELEKQFGR